MLRLQLSVEVVLEREQRSGDLTFPPAGLGA
jgi:hypothetical protein